MGSYILYRGTSHHFYTINILQTEKMYSASIILVTHKQKGPIKLSQKEEILRCMVMIHYFLCNDKLNIGRVYVTHFPSLVNHPSWASCLDC